MFEFVSLTSLGLCCALALAPGSEKVGEVDEVDAVEQSSDDEAVARAQALFQTGEVKYETHDYLGAIEAFTAAYALTEEIRSPERRDLALARLRYNLARAHVYAYDIDADDGHLERARRLIADYRADERAVGSDPDTDTDVKHLEDDLAQRERAHAEMSDAPVGDPEDTRAGTRARTRRRAGITMLVLAAPFSGLAVAGGLMGSNANDAFMTVTTQDARTAAQQRGRVGNVLLGVGVGLAVVSAATGATLLGLSARVRRDQRDGSEQATLSLHATPTGFVFAGKF